MNARILLKLLVITIATTNAIHAQELLQNSTFDSDALLWTSDPAATWSAVEDHTVATASSGTGGSLQVDTQTSNFAEQCVQVQPDTFYLLDAWVKNVSGLFGCADASWRIQLQWWAQPDCSTIEQGEPTLNSSTDVSTEWIEQQLLRLSPPETHGAKVKLIAECPSHHGVTIVYFDDVSLRKDSIFVDDFESHPVIGPMDPGTP